MRNSPAKQKQLVDKWKDAPVGTAVVVTKDDRSEVPTKTGSAPFLLGGHTACIMLDGISGCYSLERVRLAQEDHQSAKR